MANKLFNALTTEEQGMINYWIDAYTECTYSNAPARANLETLLKTWSKEKADLFEAFGNQLILSKEICIEKPEEMMANELAESMTDAYGDMRIFKTSLSEWFYSHEWEDRPDYGVMRLVNCHCLAHNKFTGTDFEIALPDGKSLKVPHGCKPLRALAKIAKAFDLKGFEEFRLAHSRILNQKQLKGEMCLSIHPMDYMTMSDNECGWTSCMSWAEDGSFHRGTVEMMNSKYVVVAYLKAKNDMTIGSKYQWSNKKWRTLIIVDEQCVASICGYPYNNDALTNLGIDWLVELCQTNKKWEYFSKNICYRYSHLGIEVKEPNCDSQFYEVSFATDDMYNDFGSCDHWIRIGKKANSYIRINYSGEASCMHCGKTHVTFCDEEDDARVLICADCDGICVCDCCGCRVNSWDTYEVDGQCLCDCCYDSRTLVCEITNEVHRTINVKRLYLVFDETDIRIFDAKYVFAYMKGLRSNSDKYAEFVKKLFLPEVYAKCVENGSSPFHIYYPHKDNDYIKRHYVRVDECSEAGLKLFGLSKETVVKYKKERDFYLYKSKERKNYL